METLFNIEELDPNQLNLNKKDFDLFMIKEYQKVFPELPDTVIAWLINPLPLYAAKGDDKMKERMEAHGKRFSENQPGAVKLVSAIRKELFDYLCTNSKTYAKERKDMGANINVLINGLAAVIATHLGGVEIGIVCTILTALFFTIAKMSKRIACEYLQPK